MRSTALFFFAVIAGTAATLVPSGLFSGAGSDRAEIRFVVWGMPFEDRLFKDVYARGHEQLNPLVTVDYQRHSDLVAKYNAWHAKGEGAEVMRLGVDYYPQFVARGMLQPLDAFIALSPPYGLTEKEMADFPQGLIDALTIDGKLYGLPQDSSQYGLYYNKSIFDQYNAEHPDDPVRYPDASWTWDDLRETARKLTERDDRGQLITAGLDMPIWAWPFFNFFAQAGGEAWSDDGLTTRVNREAGVTALAFMRTLIVDERVWEPYFGQEQGSGPTTRFAAGRTAMMFGGSWWVPFFETNNPGLDFAVSPVPRGQVAAVPCGMVVWTMSSKAANPVEGWRMIRWLVTDRQAAVYWDKLRVAPPANLGVLASDAFRQTSGIPKHNDAGDVIPGQWDVPPMPESRFADRAAWLRYAWAVDPETGRAPGYVILGRYQQQLQNELQTALDTFLANPADTDPQQILDGVAARVHEHIDRDRAAKGLPAIDRTPNTDSPD